MKWFVKVWVLLGVGVALWASSQYESTNLQLYAQKVTRDKDKVIASGNVVIYYQNKLLQADHIIYNPKDKTIDLHGHVTLLEGADYNALGEHIYIDLKDDSDLLHHYFLTKYDHSLWSRGAWARKNQDTFRLKDALLTSCNVTCPDWHIAFGSAEYNATSQWLDIYNPRFYVGKVPFFWLPYIGASTNNQRKSGFLRPSLGFSDRDGFVWQQPYYIAVDPKWDFELTPQVRLDRGAGAYGVLRFVDSPHSSGSMQFGFFHSKDDYVAKYGLKNSSHYGYDLHYENSQVLSKNSLYNDGLYIDIHYLNDSDYYNLKVAPMQAVLNDRLLHSAQVFSRANYFFNMPKNYIGLYGKYYINTSIDEKSRENTLQNLPTLQLHHYQDLLLGPTSPFEYSFDYRYNQYVSQNGKSINAHELNLPVTFYYALWNDYLKFSLSENFYYAFASFNKSYLSGYEQSDDNHYALLRNYHTFKVYTDLAKPYGSYFHTLHLSMVYNRPSFSSEKGNHYDFDQALYSPRENLQLNALNYFYDDEGRLILYYRVLQPILYEPAEGEDSYRQFGDLEQEISYRFLGHYEAYTNLFWSHYRHTISSATSFIKASYDRLKIRFNHFFKQSQAKNETEEKLIKVSDYFSIDWLFETEAAHQVYAGVSYDNLNDQVNRWYTGIHFFRRCWDLNIGLRDEIQPILTAMNRAGNIHNFSFYFTINLIPFGSFSQTIQQGR